MAGSSHWSIRQLICTDWQAAIQAVSYCYHWLLSRLLHIAISQRLLSRLPLYCHELLFRHCTQDWAMEVAQVPAHQSQVSQISQVDQCCSHLLNSCGDFKGSRPNSYRAEQKPLISVSSLFLLFFVISCPFLLFPFLSCPFLFLPVHVCPFLSFPVLSCPVLSFPVGFLVLISFQTRMQRFYW